MPHVVCNTSPLHYLYQLGLLEIIPSLVQQIIIPPAVVQELSDGRRLGIYVPDPTRYDWIIIRQPIGKHALSLVQDIGKGEAEVLLVALELSDAVVIFDDRLARWTAEMLGIPMTGTLGLLLDAKKAGLLPAVEPVLNELESLRFRLAPHTRVAVLTLAGEYE